MTADGTGASGVAPGCTSPIAAASVWTPVSPLHFVAAIGLGILAIFFQALTYAIVPVRDPELLVDYVALFAVLGACVALDRAGSRAAAGVLVACAYAVLLFAVAPHTRSSEILVGQVMSHCLVAAVIVADHGVSSGSSGRFAYAMAALAGAAAGAFVSALLVKFQPDLFGHDEGWAAEAASPRFAVLHPVYVALFWLLFGGAAVLFHGERRLASRTLARLRLAELEQLRRSREVIESQLQATQARVEPEFLFNTLGHVRRICGRDPGLAERMLDELVAFLRAAVPRMRDTSSALEQEAALARAYLGILRMHFADRFDFTIDLSLDAAQARLPSMLLLPLIEGVVHGWSSGFGLIDLRITAAVENRHLVLRIANAAGDIRDLAEPEAIGVLRERVAAVYGERGSLRLTVGPGTGRIAVLQIPYEPAA